MAEVDFYEILEIYPSASEDAVKEAYFKLAKVYHPDVSGTSDHSEAERVEKFKRVTEAYSVLSDPGRRREYDAELRARKERAKKQSPAGRDKDKRAARASFDEARTAMRHGEWEQAGILLKSAIQHDDSVPSFYSWLGFCLAKTGSNLHEARDACRKALQMEFYNADFHANLGFVYTRAGLKSTAVNSFREALKWDSEHAMAKKFLSKLGAEAPKPANQGPGLIDSLMSLFKK